jgi:hypothetical protein
MTSTMFASSYNHYPNTWLNFLKFCHCKCILKTFGEKKTLFTVSGNGSKLGMIDSLFDNRAKSTPLSMRLNA